MNSFITPEEQHSLHAVAGTAFVTGRRDGGDGLAVLRIDGHAEKLRGFGREGKLGDVRSQKFRGFLKNVPKHAQLTR